MKKNVNIIVIIILVITNAICLVQCTSTQAQVDDCVHEIDDFKNYYDATESLLDAIDSNGQLEDWLETDVGSTYLEKRKHLGNTWKMNHDSNIDDYVVTRHRK